MSRTRQKRKISQKYFRVYLHGNKRRLIFASSFNRRASGINSDLMQKIVFKNGWASHQRMHPQGWGVIEGRKATQSQAQKWAEKLGCALDIQQPEQPQPFFFDFRINSGHVMARVEFHGNATTTTARVEVSASEFFQDCIEAGVHELAGTEHPDGLAEYAYENTDLVFSEIHRVRPFEFSNIKTNSHV